ncbi:hypothetical protein [Kitasatospora sp. NPDC001527]|uniref:hypothetical protein n=1 Tax=Kitasatospora sp. NPDC001527 TaxID=3154519 RepID=UPI003327BBCE
MTLSDDTGQDAPYAHDRYRTRHGRHGRPGPFGGRLRLPTLRFSGAAMAMSTVVGISIATTFLLNEQQGVGRRAGVARVGSSPPPSPAGSPDAASGTGTGTGTTSGTGTASGAEATGPDAAAGRRPATPGPGTRAPDAVPGQRSSSPAVPRTGGSPPTVPLAEGPAPRHGVTGGPAAEPPGTGGDPQALSGGRPNRPQSAEEQLATGGAADTGAQTARRPAEDAAPPAASPSPSASTPAPSPSPSVPRPFVPAPGAPGTPTPSPREWTGGTLGTTADADAKADPSGDGAGRPAGGADEADDQALAGAAVVQSLGRDGTRHVLALTVTEPLTALQTEFRLAPGTAAPGAGTAWTDLAGAVVTAHQDHGAAVYRFTTPPGTDVRPGRYTFSVRGTRPPAGAAARPATAGHRTPQSWSASAFGIGRPRAVAALGTFAAPAAAPTAAPAPAPRATAPAG